MNEMVLETKKRNIVDMAVGFPAMMRVFKEGSAPKIKRKLFEVLNILDSIETKNDFNKVHDDFCNWFISEIKVSKSGNPSSYGHAAKVLDVVLKVLVYYCNLPSLGKAEQLLPLLNGAVDGPIFKHLITIKKSPINSVTIAMIDKDIYDSLQKMILNDIENTFDSKIFPVQYDDIMWRRLNREAA